ncbi:hypothetical protein RND81_05G147900 [Saponaria officinalis]|uniref:Bifunctional inhibitor/plant lipid transfer protein/seed storage helical domain-containing protein n=1 Tax=Saponaria officinalis TaxID=3572 RepID=A0AAW1L133_SAPOF
MGSKMMVGILVLLSLSIIPSSAQPTGSCLTEVSSCIESAKAQMYARPMVLLCCPSIQRAINNQLSCFCLGKSDLISQDATYLFDDFLQTCSIPGTLDTICPGMYSFRPGHLLSIFMLKPISFLIVNQLFFKCFLDNSNNPKHNSNNPKHNSSNSEHNPSNTKHSPNNSEHNSSNSEHNSSNTKHNSVNTKHNPDNSKHNSSNTKHNSDNSVHYKWNSIYTINK